MTEDQLKNHFQEIEDNFNKAVITNDINEIKCSQDTAIRDIQDLFYIEM